MVQPRVMVLRAPGANCDVETAFAFEQAGAVAERCHVNRLLDEPKLLDSFQILCLPGGFSYGDDLAAGRILGAQIRHHLAATIQEFHAAGKLILGICNGFQILIKSGLLLPIDIGSGVPATLTLNESGKFEDRWVHLKMAGSNCVFFQGLDEMYLPIAHAEGKFVPRDPTALDSLIQNRQVVLRYAAPGAMSASSNGILPFPQNPNGSAYDIAGICDPTGRICGLMPHPERHIDALQHPRWTRSASPGAGDGLRVFQNAVNYFR